MKRNSKTWYVLFTLCNGRYFTPIYVSRDRLKIEYIQAASTVENKIERVNDMRLLDLSCEFRFITNLDVH